MGILGGILGIVGEITGEVIKQATGVDVKSVAKDVKNGATLDNVVNSMNADIECRKEEVREKYRRKIKGLSDSQLKDFYQRKQDDLNKEAKILVEEELKRRGISY